ncbi:lipocalin family protein [Salinimicrobium marinum]|uniref:lipocalin family protein n=1 Tax=Salinimicrobium marinum TaxID=680283 RepID=UPI001672575A
MGKWQYESTTFNGSLYTPDDCEAQSTIEFFSNGKLTYIDYYIDSEENCVFEAEQETWNYLADDIYSFTVEDGDSYSVPITISEDNSSFTVMDKDEDGEYETVYVRI